MRRGNLFGATASSPRRRARFGFTLIELLVVIAVIAMLAAILFPVFAKARERARQATCQSNLKQIGLSFSAYLNDYDDVYPADEADPFLWQGRHWRWPLKTYLGYSGRKASDAGGAADPLKADGAGPNLLVCPSDPAEAYDNTSYAYAAAFYHTPDQVAAMTDPKDLYDASRRDAFPVMPQSQGDVRYPAEKALAGEWTSNHALVGGEREPGWWDWRGARVFLFADGHVRLYAANRLRRSANGFPDPNVTVGGAGGRDIL